MGRDVPYRTQQRTVLAGRARQPSPRGAPVTAGRDASLRWRAGRPSSRRSPSATSGVSGSWPPTRTCRAAPSIGSSTRWHAWSCSRKPGDRDDSGSVPSLTRLSVLLAERLDVRDRGTPGHGGGGRGAGRDAGPGPVLADASPVLGRGRGRIDPPHPLHLGPPAPVERAAHGIERQGHPGLPAGRRAGRRPATRCPTRCRVTGRHRSPPCARSWTRRAPAAMSSATANGSRVRWVSRRPSVTPPAGSSATSSSAGPTTAPAPRRRLARARSSCAPRPMYPSALGYRIG